MVSVVPVTYSKVLHHTPLYSSSLYSDINECELYSPCTNADCYNLEGNYTCGICFHGFNRTNYSQQPCGMQNS